MNISENVHPISKSHDLNYCGSLVTELAANTSRVINKLPNVQFKIAHLKKNKDKTFKNSYTHMSKLFRQYI